MSLLRVIEVLKDDGKGGNPYHDEHGKFTSGPHGSNLEKIGPKKGTVPGGIYQDKTTGHSYVVKEYKNPLQAGTEATTNHLYAAAGIPAAETHAVSMGGKIVGAGKMIPGITEGNQSNVSKVGSELAKGYGVDAMTANWDVVGQTHDNIAIKNGIPIRIDNGGSLQFRAQGGSKDFPGDKVHELKTLLDSSKNPNTSAIYNKEFDKNPTAKAEAMERVGNISDKDIKDAVSRGLGAAGATAEQQKDMVGRLIGRRDLILEEAKTLRGQIAKDQEAAQKKAELKAQKEAEKQAAIAAGTYVPKTAPRMGPNVLNSIEKSNLDSALKKSEAELKTSLDKMYESSGINRFLGGKTDADFKSKIARDKDAFKIRAATQAMLIKQGVLQYNPETGEMSKLTLMRGIGVPANEMNNLKPGGNFNFGKLACFTDKEKTAYGFAHSNGLSSQIGIKTSATVPVVVHAVTPGKRIMGSYKTKAGSYPHYSHEQEYTLHQPFRCTVKSVEVITDYAGRKTIKVNGEFKG